jgi:hypothetical protein
VAVEKPNRSGKPPARTATIENRSLWLYAEPTLNGGDHISSILERSRFALRCSATIIPFITVVTSSTRRRRHNSVSVR